MNVALIWFGPQKNFVIPRKLEVSHICIEVSPYTTYYIDFITTVYYILQSYTCYVCARVYNIIWVKNLV